MSESRQEETRASEQNAEEEFLRLDCNHHSVEIPRPNSSHGDRSEAVPSIADEQLQEREMRSDGCDPPTIREHSGQPDADRRELGGQPEWEVRSEWRDQRAFFPGSEFADGVAAEGSSDEESSSIEVITPPSSRRSVAGPSLDGEAALRRPELAAERQRSHRRRCRRAAWEERELWPCYSCYPHLGPCEWSWGRPRAADCHTCSGSACHLTVRVELELWPSCSSYPDLGPCEWSWGRPRSTSRCREHCPRYRRAHRF